MFFGQTSTLLRYWHQGQVAVRAAGTVLAITVPIAIAGRLASYAVPPSWLLATFALLLFALALGVYCAHARSGDGGEPVRTADGAGDRAGAAGARAPNGDASERRVAQDGAIRGQSTTAAAAANIILNARDRATFGAGGLLAGLVGFGIGELSNVTLHARKGVPIKYSTGTSTLVLYLTLLTATVTNVLALELGVLGIRGAVDVPWEVAAVIAPVVVVGGQVGAYVNGRLSDHLVVRALAGAYVLVGAVTLLRLFG